MSAIIFINMEVLKNLLKGVIINRTIIKIEMAVQLQIFLVTFVKILKLSNVFDSI
jgi:hypothetical protein